MPKKLEEYLREQEEDATVPVYEPPLDTPIEPSVAPKAHTGRIYGATVMPGEIIGSVEPSVAPSRRGSSWDAPYEFGVIPATDHDALEAQLTSEPADGVEKVISTREATHGSYADTARVAQTLKRVLRNETAHYETLNSRQRESLDLICTKLARIVSGNANEPDHWLDIQGYAKIAIDEVE